MTLFTAWTKNVNDSWKSTVKPVLTMTRYVMLTAVKELPTAINVATNRTAQNNVPQVEKRYVPFKLETKCFFFVRLLGLLLWLSILRHK